MRLLYLLLTAAGLLAQLPARAQQLDPAFAPTVNLTDGSATTAVALQPDGKVLLSMTANRYNSQLGGSLVRLNADGTPDVAFRTRAGAGPGYNYYGVRALAVQPDGKIIVAGSYLSAYDGAPRAQPMRLNADGSLDTSFDATAAGWTAGDVSDVAVQPDGKILVAGTGSGPAAQRLTRLLPNGSVDPAFASTIGFQAAGSNVTEMQALLLQADGKIVLGGNFTYAGNPNRNSLVRFNADGSLDTGFTSPLGLNTLVMSVAQQADGKLVVGGGGLLNNVSGLAPHVLRLLADGSVDPTFQQSLDAYGIVSDVRVQANGDIVAAGSFTTFGGLPRGSVVRLSSNGTPDAGFTTAPGAGGYVAALLPLPGGQYLAGGYYSSFDGQPSPGLTRLTAAGRLDPAFAPVLTSAAAIYDPVPLLNGQLHLQLGTEFNGRPLPYGGYHRLQADGTYDAAVPLYEPLPGLPGVAHHTPQPDGTFYQAYPVVGTNLVGINRLLATGALDPGFRPDTLDFGNVGVGGVGIVVLPSGKIALSGAFARLNGQPRPGLALLLPTGVPDPGFAPALNSPWTQLLPFEGVRAVQPQPNGRLAVLWSDASRAYIQRLNADGSVDASFSLGSPAGGSTGYFGMTTLVSNQLLLRGSFTSFGGQPTPNGLVRLLPDGRPDPGFVAASACQGVVEQPDGRLLITVAGANALQVSLQRLLPGGGLDTSFQPVAIASEVGQAAFAAVTLQPVDHNIIVWGNFTRVAGEPRFGLARLVNTPLATRPLVAAPVLDVFPNPAHAQVQLRLPARATGSAALLDLQGRTVQSWSTPATETTLVLAGLAPGVYVLRVPTTAGTAHQRIVVE
jgi:uncharacterized delta-60 repeat protein